MNTLNRLYLIHKLCQYVLHHHLHNENQQQFVLIRSNSIESLIESISLNCNHKIFNNNNKQTNTLIVPYPIWTSRNTNPRCDHIANCQLHVFNCVLTLLWIFSFWFLPTIRFGVCLLLFIVLNVFQFIDPTLNRKQKSYTTRNINEMKSF